MADPNGLYAGNYTNWTTNRTNFPTSGSYGVPRAYPLSGPAYPLPYVPAPDYGLDHRLEEPHSSTSSVSTPNLPFSDVSEPLPNHGIKKVKLFMKSQPPTTEDPYETPAMRLKSRPKRPTLNLVQPDPYSDRLSDDEDYVAPKSSSSLPSKFQADRSMLPGTAGQFPPAQEKPAFRAPSNAYTLISYSAWPTHSRVSNLEENDGRDEEGGREAQQREASSQDTEKTNRSSVSTPQSHVQPVSSSSPSLDQRISAQGEIPVTEAQEGENKMILSVPEYDQFMSSCDMDEFIADLNYPEAAPVEGLSEWMSTLERKMWKEGLNPYEPPRSDWEDVKWKEGTYINCDLRYYDLAQLGKFDVVLIDPPWRIRGAQNVSDEKTIFNNNKFTLQYNTMSNEEIMDLDVGQVSDRGFIFLWTINSQLQTAFECLNRWGYTFVDRITWVKKTNKDSVFIGQGYYLLHSTEICLIGAKKDAEGNYLEVVQKVSNDLIFASTQKKSQKPEQMYHIIERMFPGARKVELFARNHNIRPGWFSIGNQLGVHYNWAHDDITCDECKRTIVVGQVRYKHRHVADRDLCGACFSKSGESIDSYFELSNRFDEQTFHEYYECNGCGANPLWGIRFTCQSCPDFDLCETCHDQRVVPEPLKDLHHSTHQFKAFEVPEIAGGLSVHRHRCLGCNTFPIVGCRFKCAECSGNVSLCQKCFFAKKTPRNHLDTHQMNLITEPLLTLSQVRCDICRTKPIIGPRFKCQQCINFEICQNCHDMQRPPPANYASHRPTHTFTKIMPDVDIDHSSVKEHKGGAKGWGPADPDYLMD